MKKFILSLASCVGSLIFAQSVKTSHSLSYGVKAGVNASYLEDASKVAFYGGGFVNIPLSPKFSLQPEVLYSGLGAKTAYVPDVSGVSFYQDNKVKLDLHYISYPFRYLYNII